ncbi:MULTISPECIES: type II secretion system inner membrane protein GspF [Desulfobacula]|uniref:General secretion pathway protein F n=2 Tax=Desulfobacula TaxID=28222 RepID=K0NEQ9_DESTT|nr:MULTISPECIES: type II secretion system inner membrane protein GspF [Desulfobacula]CCK79556.1 GspF: general secretion pathway protein F [Desulfobacula toluolica Tol2]SDT84617.1 general secretion pathway protein F [Desulfobacula phenolica]
MPVYEYTALNKKGKNISGLLNADNIKAATGKLRSSKIFPISITEITTRAGKQKKGFSFFYSPVRSSEIAMMTRQLATLITAGFPLTTALNTLLPQTKNQSFKRILSGIKDAIEEGSSFAAALSQYPGIFSVIYINMVKAGEASGTLEIVLERLADIYEKQNKLNRKIKSAMAYPLLMTLVGIGVLFFLLTVIVPNITSIFEEMNQSLPLTTQILINTSRFLKHWWWVIAGIIGLLMIFYHIISKKSAVQTAIDKFILNLPVAGELVQKISVARLTRTLGSLLENGVSLLDALEIVKNITGNKIIANAILEAKQEVECGRELGDVLSQNAHFPYLAVQMIKVGEQSGNLESMLKKTARVYDDEIETTIIGMTTIMEPLIILVMGVVVGFIVLSICLPIFEMNQLVR